MHYYEVAPNQITRASSAYYTYAFAEPLEVGHIVLIEVGKRSFRASCSAR
jgi:hypothetical protein